MQQWKQNESEGHWFYFLDPNGHKMELHVGHLTSRLKFVNQHHMMTFNFTKYKNSNISLLK